MPPRKKKIAEEEVSLSLPDLPEVAIPSVGDVGAEEDAEELVIGITEALLAAMGESSVEELVDIAGNSVEELVDIAGKLQKAQDEIMEEPAPEPAPEPRIEFEVKEEATLYEDSVEEEAADEEEVSFDEIMAEVEKATLPPVTVLPKDQSSIAALPSQISEGLSRRLQVASDAIDLFKKEKLQSRVVAIGPFVAVDKTKAEKMVARIAVVSSRSYAFIDVIDDVPRTVCKALIRAAVQ